MNWRLKDAFVSKFLINNIIFQILLMCLLSWIFQVSPDSYHKRRPIFEAQIGENEFSINVSSNFNEESTIKLHHLFNIYRTLT